MYPKLFLFPLISDSEIMLLRRNSNHSDEILKIVEERKIEIIFESIWAQYPIGSLWSIISGSEHNRIIVPHLPPVLWKKNPVGGFFATTKFNCLNHANPNIDAIVITFCGVWFRFWKFKSSIVAYVINGIVFIFYWSGNGSQRRKPYFQFFNLWNCFLELSAEKVSPPQRNVECVWTIPNGNGFLTHIIETCFLTSGTELMRYLVREPSDAKGNRCDATRRRANFYCQGCSNRFQRRAACSSWCVDVSDKVRKINLIFCKITCESQKNV